ncbi:MAG: chorismate--pyruvate lyase [Hominenteromicrobium sp.]
MGPYEYIVARIDGDYAVLRRTDNDTHDEILVARALLPEEIDENTRLLYEAFQYTVISGGI